MLRPLKVWIDFWSEIQNSAAEGFVDHESNPCFPDHLEESSSGVCTWLYMYKSDRV